MGKILRVMVADWPTMFALWVFGSASVEGAWGAMNGDAHAVDRALLLAAVWGVGQFGLPWAARKIMARRVDRLRRTCVD